jgi:hypothetical protein
MLTPPALILTIFSLAIIAIILSLFAFVCCAYLYIDIVIESMRDEIIRNREEAKAKRKAKREEKRLQKEIESFEFI